MYFLPLLDKEPILKPMTCFHALGSLACKSVTKAPGLVCLFLPLPPRVLGESVLFGPTLGVRPCYLAPAWSIGEEVWVCSPGKGCVQMHPRVQCERVHAHLYMRLRLFLRICARWLPRGLNQRVAALPSSCDVCVSRCPALGSPKLPSLVPSQRTSRAGVEAADPVRVPACLGGRAVRRGWCVQGAETRGFERGAPAELRLVNC